MAATKAERLKVLRKWVKTLREGPYTQATGQLGYNAHARCCLGVLCEVMHAEYGVPTKCMRNPSMGPVHSEAVFDGCFNALPNRVSEFLRVTPCVDIDSMPDPFSDDPATCLTRLNDKGYTFEDIADIIEEHLIKPLETKAQGDEVPG